MMIDQQSNQGNSRSQQFGQQQQPFAQTPEGIRQAALQISDDLRQCQQVLTTKVRQIVQEDEQLQTELNAVAVAITKTLAGVADRVQSQTASLDAILQTVSQQRAALAQLLPRNQQQGQGWQNQSTDTVSQALEDQLQSMRNESDGGIGRQQFRGAAVR